MPPATLGAASGGAWPQQVAKPGLTQLHLSFPTRARQQGKEALHTRRRALPALRQPWGGTQRGQPLRATAEGSGTGDGEAPAGAGGWASLWWQPAGQPSSQEQAGPSGRQCREVFSVPYADVAVGAAAGAPMYQGAQRRVLQSVASTTPAMAQNAWASASAAMRSGWTFAIGLLLAVAMQLAGRWLQRQRWALQIMQQLGWRKESNSQVSTSSQGAPSAAAEPRSSSNGSRRRSDSGSTSGTAAITLAALDAGGNPEVVELGETVEWVNMCWRKSWQVYQRGLERWFQDLLQPVFDNVVAEKQVPHFIKRLQIVEFTIDHEAPYFSNMRRRSSRKDSDLTGVMDLRYTGGARMLLMVEIGWRRWRFRVPVMVSELDLESPMWVKVRLAPLCPWVGTISLAFVGRPNVKVQLSPYNRLQLMRIPIIQSFLRKFFTVDLPGFMALPRRLEINIPPSVTSVAEAAVGRDTIMRAVASAVLQADALENALMGALPLGPQQAAGGVTLPQSFRGELSVKLREGRNLPVQALRWQSNPYCLLRLGEQTMLSRREGDTSHIGAYRSPHWNQAFQFLVEDPSSQVLQLSVRDTALTGGAAELASASLPLSLLGADGGLLSVWLPLRSSSSTTGDGSEGASQGEVLLDVSYHSFADDDKDSSSGFQAAAVQEELQRLAQVIGSMDAGLHPEIRDVRSAAEASSKAAVAASAAAAAIAMTKAAAARAATRIAARASAAAQAAAEAAVSGITAAAPSLSSGGGGAPPDHRAPSAPKLPQVADISFDEDSGAPEGWAALDPSTAKALYEPSVRLAAADVNSQLVQEAAEQLMSAAFATNGVLPGRALDHLVAKGGDAGSSGAAAAGGQAEASTPASWSEIAKLDHAAEAGGNGAAAAARGAVPVAAGAAQATADAAGTQERRWASELGPSGGNGSSSARSAAGPSGPGYGAGSQPHKRPNPGQGAPSSNGSGREHIDPDAHASSGAGAAVPADGEPWWTGVGDAVARTVGLPPAAEPGPIAAAAPAGTSTSPPSPAATTPSPGPDSQAAGTPTPSAPPPPPSGGEQKAWWQNAIGFVNSMLPRRAVDLVDGSETDALANKQEEEEAGRKADEAAGQKATSATVPPPAPAPAKGGRPWWAFWARDDDGSGSKPKASGDGGASQPTGSTDEEGGPNGSAKSGGGGKGPVETVILPADLPLEEIAKEVVKLQSESGKAKEEYIYNLWKMAVEKNNRSWAYLIAFLLAVAIGLLTVVAYRLGHTGPAPPLVDAEVAVGMPLAVMTLLWIMLKQM